MASKERMVLLPFCQHAHEVGCRVRHAPHHSRCPTAVRARNPFKEAQVIELFPDGSPNTVVSSASVMLPGHDTSFDHIRPLPFDMA